MPTIHEKKFVSGDPSKCIGCCVCEYACSMKHENTYNPTKSRIRAIRLNSFVNLAVSCRLCEDSPCVAACPRDALRQSEETGTILIDEEKCNGCGLCEDFCPLVAIHVKEGILKNRARPSRKTTAILGCFDEA